MLPINGPIAKIKIILVGSLSGSPTETNNVKSIRTPAIIVAFTCSRLFPSISIVRASVAIEAVFPKNGDLSNKVAI